MNDEKINIEMKAKGAEDNEPVLEEKSQALEEFQEQDGEAKAVEGECIPLPPIRYGFSFNAHPLKDELLLFGGEFFDGNKTYTYNDLYVYKIQTNEWIRLKLTDVPPPRCSHQAVAVARKGCQLWVFGGEFESRMQLKFNHFKDLWVFNFREKTWEEITAPGGPSERSGHRMVAVKERLIVFGGFRYDTVTYHCFNDLHAFDLHTNTWTKLEVEGEAPCPRYGCQMLAISDSRILIFGGFSKIRRSDGMHNLLVRRDMFILVPDESDSTGTKWLWTAVEPSGPEPNLQAGYVMKSLPDSSKAYMFGIALDAETVDNLTDHFYGVLCELDVDDLKWRTVRMHGKKGLDEEEAGGNDKKGANDSDAVEGEDGIAKLKIGPQDVGSAGASCIAPEDIKCYAPLPRMCPGLAMKNGMLYLFGGVFREDIKKIVMADMYALDLQKMDVFTVLSDYDETQRIMDLSGSDSSSEEDVKERKEGEEDEDSSDSMKEFLAMGCRGRRLLC